MKIFRTFIPFCLLFISMPIKAERIQLNYTPKGQIVKLYFDSLTIYTDTTALFAVYDTHCTLKDYCLRIKQLVRKRVAETESDTVTFTGHYIPFNDSVQNEFQKDWYVMWCILHLLKTGQLVIYDEYGLPVKTIVTKIVGKRKLNYINRVYINKATGEQLFYEAIYRRYITPDF